MASAKEQDIFVTFDCPRGVGVGRGRCQAQIIGPDAPWKNIGTADKPTLDPSYNCVGGCGWHGFIVDGETFDNPTSITGKLTKMETLPALVTMLHACANCHHPELLTVGIIPDEASLGLILQRTEVRKPHSLTPSEETK